MLPRPRFLTTLLVLVLGLATSTAITVFVFIIAPAAPYETDWNTGAPLVAEPFLAVAYGLSAYGLHVRAERPQHAMQTGLGAAFFLLTGLCLVAVGISS